MHHLLKLPFTRTLFPALAEYTPLLLTSVRLPGLYVAGLTTGTLENMFDDAANINLGEVTREQAYYCVWPVVVVNSGKTQDEKHKTSKFSPDP